MRVHRALFALAAIATFSIFYSAYKLAGRHPDLLNRVKSQIGYHTNPVNLVVFGDSWSDNGPKANGQGEVWTEWLCTKLSCHHENFAQSSKWTPAGYTGAVADNAILELPDPPVKHQQTPLADLKQQVGNWAELSQKYNALLTPEELVHEKNNTIFVIQFGLWDLWHTVNSDKSFDAAKAAIDNSLNVVFDQLRVLADSFGSKEIKVIMMTTADITFLPAYTPGTLKQRDVVELSQHWNRELRSKAEGWSDALIYLFDVNAFMLDQIRDRQLFNAGMLEKASGEEPQWENVKRPCVEDGREHQVFLSSGQCSNPEKFLFWDGMHLGSAAHELMAHEIYKDVSKLAEGWQLK